MICGTMANMHFGSVLLISSIFTITACATPSEPVAADEADLRETPCKNLPTSWMKTWRTPADSGKLQLRVGEALPQGKPLGDILFLHGFADRFDNHRPLFEEWTRRGFRVVSFEYPSHGETCGRNLAFYLYPSLANLARQVERETVQDPDRPLLVAGWSMGGLLATRMLQGGLGEGFTRPVAGAMLLTPGVDVRVFLSAVSNETLTRNPDPPHTGPIQPTRPSTFPIAANLLYHAGEAREHSLPPGVPVLTVVGGDEEDVYAKSKGIRNWALDQRSRGADSIGLACAGGYHEIDNEPAPMGPQVQYELGAFAESVIKNKAYASPRTGACQGF
jgi:alpha-beta hydrolase superfamily lysophospholipase